VLEARRGTLDSSIVQLKRRTDGSHWGDTVVDARALLPPAALIRKSEAIKPMVSPYCSLLASDYENLRDAWASFQLTTSAFFYAGKSRARSASAAAFSAFLQHGDWCMSGLERDSASTVTTRARVRYRITTYDRHSP